MTSQIDLDQGGTSREWVDAYLGPSVGWVRLPSRNLLNITAAGTYTLDYSTNLVHVNTTAVVTIFLPSAIDPSVPAGVLPGKFGKVSIGIVDISGQPQITIKPATVAETIMSLTQIQINSAYSGFILYPSNALRGWTNQA